ncbi:phosphatidylinositol 3,4,5-trisphosphate 3-phosphatase and dual-specificity protein phosphatase PTEN isoform X3 [Agrilus planipennis]|nr:phosphatidylinositol 3,4,5-trisphosphate 3-phosphatase and dual-specificity protein phosphatase PTEN isoform X3 [Agrilus planipennis]
MSNSFPNMNITNPIKGLVSKRRNRYKKDGFNLDLTYITDNVIAMGYPASNIEGVYRNHIDDVVKFLESKHRDHYFIYNLCSERSYDCSKFHNRVRTFPFDDHNPPKIELIRPFCDDVHTWLTKDPRNVAAVHCKAGKGRTGTMICCYLLHSGQFVTAEEALNFYGQTRTQDRKGVTIPSQLRYVNYYASFLRDGLDYVPVSLYIREIIFEPTPCFPGGQGYLCFSISQQTIANAGEHSQKCVKLFKSGVYEVRKGSSSFVIRLDQCMPITGDVKLEFYNKPKLGRKEKIFQFWFNTFFVRNELSIQDTTTEPNGHLPENGNGVTRNVHSKALVLSLMKNELDIVNKKDKQNKVFSSEFKVTVLMHKVPTKNPGPPSWLVTPTFHQETRQDTPSESSEADTSEDEYNDEDDWDSVLEGEDVDPRGIGYRLLSECDLASQLAHTSADQQQQELLTA